MVRGYRHVFIAVVGVVTLFGSACYGLYIQALYDQEAQHRGANYAERAANQVEQSCIGMTPPQKAKCLKIAESEYRLKIRDNQREQDDLAAQQTSALWTSIMGIAALIGMALSAVGVAFVWTTFQETRVANDIARENMFAAYRPRLHIDVRGSLVANDEIKQFGDNETQRIINMQAVATIENLGAEPITLLQGAIWAEIGEPAPTMQRRNEVIVQNAAALFGWGASTDPAPDMISVGQFCLTPANRDDFMQGDFCVQGVVHYSNVLDEVFEHYFRFKVGPVWASHKFELFEQNKRKLRAGEAIVVQRDYWKTAT